MSKRIRFIDVQKNAPHLQQSSQIFLHPTNGSRYRIFLDLKEHQWKIVETNTELTAVSGHIIGVTKMRNEAKDALKVLGIVFETESGKRKPYKKRDNTSTKVQKVLKQLEKI